MRQIFPRGVYVSNKKCVITKMKTIKRYLPGYTLLHVWCSHPYDPPSFGDDSTVDWKFLC